MNVANRGTWPPGLAFVRLGEGPPLLYLPGLTPHHRLPQGMDQVFLSGQLKPFTSQHEVWWVNRRQGLVRPVTMAGIAADYAHVIRDHFDAPVDVIGISTGGSVALALALDHPDVLRRLVITSAYRLSDRGRRIQQRMASEIRSGHPRRAAALEFRAMGSSPTASALLGRMGWMMGATMYREAGADLLAVIEAEDTFDVGSRLSEVTAPTLVIGGELDRFYHPQLFRNTASRMPRGQLILYPRKGHMAALSGRQFYRDALAFLAGDLPEARNQGDTHATAL